MPDRSDVVYRYDGSFEGVLCCVFESYEKKEIPSGILPPDAAQATLFPAKEIFTDSRKSARVLRSISEKMGAGALELVRLSFLTCLPDKELQILLFLRLGYRYGPAVMHRLTDGPVDTLMKAVKHLTGESHLLKGFIRFSDFGGALAAEIGPKNFVLPLLTGHFCGRYPEERFLIYDRTHGMALVYQPYQPAILPVEELELPEPDETERSFRSLWKLFYDTVAIESRYNPKCRMSHMPKRYWSYMTEFGSAKAPLREPPGIARHTPGPAGFLPGLPPPEDGKTV